MPALNVISSPSPVFSVDISVPFNVKINGEQNDQSGLSGRMHSADTDNVSSLANDMSSFKCGCVGGKDNKCLFDDTTSNKRDCQLLIIRSKYKSSKIFHDMVLITYG